MPRSLRSGRPTGLTPTTSSSAAPPAPGDTPIEPDLDLAERIVSRCAEVEPRLHDAQILGHQVGLRPTRPTPRLEAEPIGTARCVHSYGHGGSGVTHSWGAALDAAHLLLESA